MKIENYKSGFKIVSFARNDSSAEKLFREEKEFIHEKNSGFFFMPENAEIFIEGYMNPPLSDYDVLEIYPDGRIIRTYCDSEEDKTFLITNHCNSNCIMCPTPEYVRRYDEDTAYMNLIKTAEYIPDDLTHITVTGGEPFLAGKSIFSFINKLKSRFYKAELLILTNGRIFSVPEYCLKLKETAPEGTILAIPLHGHTGTVHDQITQSPGSFNQTVRGIKNLIEYGFKIEIRIVISRLNYLYMDAISDFIIGNFKNLHCVHFIAMEMLGNARINADTLWVPYTEAFKSCENSLKKIISSGIDAGLYNFPLCTVSEKYWPLCAESISPGKIRFSGSCRKCSVNDICGGVFAGTMDMVESELKPVGVVNHE